MSELLRHLQHSAHVPILNTTYKRSFCHRHQNSRSFLRRKFVLHILFRLTSHFRLLELVCSPSKLSVWTSIIFRLPFCSILQVPSFDCASALPFTFCRPARPTFATSLFPFFLPKLLSFVRVTSSKCFWSSFRSFCIAYGGSRAVRAVSCRPLCLERVLQEEHA